MAEPDMEIPEEHDYPTPDHVIIWLDDHIGKPGECKKLKKAFGSNLDPQSQTCTLLTDFDFDNLLRTSDGKNVQFAGVPFHLLAFDDPNRCYESFERHKDKHIYFITSGILGEHVIPMLIKNHKELFTDPETDKSYYSIYVFCGNTKYHYKWLYEARDYVQTFNHEADLLARMTRDVADYFVEQGERHIQDALCRYKWSKKLFSRYSTMGGNCVEKMKHVEVMMAGIERITQPQISNPHVDEIKLEDDEGYGQPSS
jgi:hypothetical protein